MLSGFKPLSIYTKEHENQLVTKLFTHEKFNGEKHY